jgi:hypothetical protein
MSAVSATEVFAEHRRCAEPLIGIEGDRRDLY